LFDFFVSRRGSAKDKALEVVLVLEKAGHKVRVQDKDIKSGQDFLAQMDKFVKECRDCIAILTKDYFDDKPGWTKLEWNNFNAAVRDSDGQRRLIPLRVDNFKPDGINRTTVYVDLVGLTKAQRRKKILDEAAGVPPPKPRAAVASSVSALKFHGVPDRNAVFVGRGELLEQLHQRMTRSKVARVAIQGLGGVGKSSLAAEYAYRYGGEYAGVWWAQAETRVMLVESLAALDSILDANGADVSSASANGAGTSSVKVHQEERAKSALRKLAASTRPWLLIYDNAERPEDISRFFPISGARLLITTRRTNWLERAVEFPVGTFSEPEACRLLRDITRLKDNPGAIRLAKALGYLPLALYHAAAYVKHAGITFDEYSARIDSLIAKGPGGDASKSVAATFTLAIERATDHCPDALKLLSFFSMLGADHIPRDLVDDSIVAADARDDAMAALASVSLIQFEEPDGGGLSINVHRLVQAAMRRRLGWTGAEEALKSAIARLSKVFPTEIYVDRRSWPLCKQLLPHVLALRENARKAKLETQELAVLLNSAANYQLTLSSFAQSESLFNESLAIAERMWGPDDIRVGKWTCDLGSLYLNSAHYELAKEKYDRAITIAVQERGEYTRNDPWLARPLANRGYAAMRLKEFDQAEGWYTQALASLGASDGTKNYWVAATLHKLGYLYWETKRYDEAERTIGDAIEMGKVVEADPMRICDWLADLAGVLRDSGRIKEAEKLYRDSIACLDRIVGDDHSATSWARRGYAELLLKAKRLKEAREVAARVVEVQRRLFGPDHRWTREAEAIMSGIIAAQGKRAEGARTPAKPAAGGRTARAS